MDKKPSKKDLEAVARMITNAEATVKLERVLGWLSELSGNDLPAIASLFDLLLEHPKIANAIDLLGAVSAIQSVFVRAWDDVESICEVQ